MTSLEGERPWFWEGNVQGTLARHLDREGWTVTETADTEAKAPGIDLLATKADRWLAVEVKGYPSTTYDHGPKRGQLKPTQPTNQARQWFSHALLGMMLLRDRRPDAEIALCFPDFKTYENLIGRTQYSFGLLGFGVYLVTEGGEARLVLPHVGVGGAAVPADPNPGLLPHDYGGRDGEKLVASVSDGGGPTTCRGEVLAAFARLEHRHGRFVFAPVEIVHEVQSVTDRYPVQTIRTEVVSRMCGEAPVNHVVAYDDLERVGRGQYRRRGSGART